ncbi:phosphopantetheine-binding protein [Niabella hibiscisoli]|uniref:phosphopantetheine-binding protein n=1 Tax=Niabella hibiscisoli TaxID=1825928 RepID=UPI001F11723E|nr:phosphopantetheine-binding protein [Niabella hibiscisoli]MCH5715850.1 phosphopantetheine-binding protein [Niabella hibiscisoli]
MQEIIEKTNAFLVEEFEADASLINPGASLKEVLDLDSLDYIDLVVALESNFHFKVQPGDFLPLVTFQDFYSYIQAQIQKKESVS